MLYSPWKIRISIRHLDPGGERVPFKFSCAVHTSAPSRNHLRFTIAPHSCRLCGLQEFIEGISRDEEHAVDTDSPKPAGSDEPVDRPRMYTECFGHFRNLECPSRISRNHVGKILSHYSSFCQLRATECAKINDRKEMRLRRRIRTPLTVLRFSPILQKGRWLKLPQGLAAETSKSGGGAMRWIY